MAGVRSSKTVGSTTYKYDTLSGKIMRQTWDDQVIDFIYDESGKPYAMLYQKLIVRIYTRAWVYYERPFRKLKRKIKRRIKKHKNKQ